MNEHLDDVASVELSKWRRFDKENCVSNLKKAHKFLEKYFFFFALKIEGKKKPVTFLTDPALLQ